MAAAKRAKADGQKRGVKYRIVMISIWEGDLAALDAKVEKIRERGIKTNRSAFIRRAVKNFSVVDFLIDAGREAKG